MVFDRVPRLLRCRSEHPLQLSFEFRGEREVSDLPARGTHEMVVVARQVFGDLIAGVIAPGDDPGDGSHLLEHGQIAISARLRKRAVSSDELRERHRLAGLEEDGNKAPAAGRVALPACTEPLLYRRVDVGHGHGDILVLEIGLVLILALVTVMTSFRPLVTVFLVFALASACASEGGNRGSGDGASIVVTTSILGDVVEAIVGDAAEVTTIMPAGSDPHEFQASAREVAAIRSADLLVVNGGGFEHGLVDVIEGAADDGVPVLEAISFVDRLTAESGEEEGEVDPHFFTDPERMSSAVRGIAEAIQDGVKGVDQQEIETATEAYLAELEELDGEIEEMLSPIPSNARILVTNHEVFGYFAERYGFEVVGVVVPGAGEGGGSGRDLARLADVITERNARAIFVDSSSSDQLAKTLAAEVGDVEVIQLFSESLGSSESGGATYVEMMRTNATRIAEALQ